MCGEGKEMEKHAGGIIGWLAREAEGYCALGQGLGRWRVCRGASYIGRQRVTHVRRGVRVES